MANYAVMDMELWWWDTPTGEKYYTRIKSWAVHMDTSRVFITQRDGKFAAYRSWEYDTKISPDFDTLDACVAYVLLTEA